MPNPETIVEALRARICLADLVGDLVELRPAGGQLRGSCSAHPDMARGLSVDEEVGAYRCHACGRQGDVVRWTRETERCSEATAIALLCRRVGWAPPAV